MSAINFSELNEDTLEELVKLSEEESEKEFTFEYQNYLIEFSNLDSNFHYFNMAQMNNIIASNYTEPNQENLFSPPENIV